MFQTYDDPGGPALGRKHLPQLRKALKAAGLDGFITPHEDEWQNEYVPAAYDRLAWTTGFTGSAGAAVVFADEAAIFTDGRYTLQVRAQVDGDLFKYLDLVDGGPAAYLRERATKGARIGYDPKLHSPDSLDRLRAAVEGAGAVLVPTPRNPIDEIWDDRPPVPAAKVVPQQETYTGESAASKRHRLGDGLSAEKADAVVITSPASIAWLFNVRGGDVARTPLPLGEALLRADGTADLFLADEKVSAELRQWLGNEVAIKASEELQPALASLKGQRVLLRTDAFKDQDLEGLVNEITPMGDPVAKTFRIKIALPDDTPLKPGISVEANVVAREKPNALLIPADAVSGSKVFVLSGDRVRERTITTGLRGTRAIEVLSGLAETEQVASVSAATALKDGQRVRITARGKATP